MLRYTVCTSIIGRRLRFVKQQQEKRPSIQQSDASCITQRPMNKTEGDAWMHHPQKADKLRVMHPCITLSLSAHLQRTKARSPKAGLSLLLEGDSFLRLSGWTSLEELLFLWLSSERPSQAILADILYCGKVLKAVMPLASKATRGKADGKVVSQLVREMTA